MDYFRVINLVMVYYYQGEGQAIGRNSSEDTILFIQIGIDKGFVFEEQQQKVLTNFPDTKRKVPISQHPLWVGNYFVNLPDYENFHCDTSLNGHH